MDRFAGKGSPLSAEGFEEARARVAADAQALWAVLAVETSGCGYLVDRRPKILFERHHFHRHTRGVFDSVDPDVSAPTAGGYGAGGAHQYMRLQAAIALDPHAALLSASWGLGQIMGSNHRAAGFDSVELMVDAFVASEDNQLHGMVAFVKSNGLDKSLAQKSWASFARLYNGPNYAANHYDEHLELFCGQFTFRGCPQIRVRQAQVYLTYLNYDVGGVDGMIGKMTKAALRKFQQRSGLSPTGTPDDETLAALLKA
jgi:hypothetical protein